MRGDLDPRAFQELALPPRSDGFVLGLSCHQLFFAGGRLFFGPGIRGMAPDHSERDLEARILVEQCF